ncbi:MAG: hypothetical protein V1928_02635, partial [Parcubacteria group bacterium]
RLHIENILPVIEMALEESTKKEDCFGRSTSSQLKNKRPTTYSAAQSADRLALRRHLQPIDSIDYIAVCSGPGLMSSLLVGVETAKTLAWVYRKPLIKINHLEGHLLSVNGKTKKPKNEKTKELQAITYHLKFPAVGLIVSGGHTQIVLMKDYLKYKIIGQTRDDAAGEAFDKAAKILGLGYPGGPAISAEAEKIQSTKHKISAAQSCRQAALRCQNKFKIKNLKFKINLPRPMINTADFDFSFSGLKTAILYKWQALQKELSPKELKQARPVMANEIQNAIVDILVSKTIAAAKQFKAKTVILGGGVSANDFLREYLNISISKYLPDVKFLFPGKEFSGDNAAMIGIAAYYHAKNKDFVDLFEVKVDPNWQLE